MNSKLVPSDTAATAAAAAAVVVATSDSHGAAQHQPPGPTLLPAPVAQAVSLATRSTSLAIRIGSLVSSFGLDAARVTTLSSLELARGMIEGVMSRAAKDTITQARTELAAADAETVLERSLENLHYAVTQVAFWTSVSFHFTGSTLSTASEGSQLLLSSFDQLFGSTDSSRAVASIITLIRREFQSPLTGFRGERVGVVDLTLALSTLAYLQQACRKTAEEERRRQSFEEVIWDVVVLSDGERVDVDEQILSNIQGGYGDSGRKEKSPSPTRSPWTGTEDDEAVMNRLKSQIVANLSPGTTVSVSNSVASVQTITIVETRALTPTPKRRSWMPFTSDEENADSTYRVVYKIHRNKFRTSSFKSEDESSDPAVVELTDDSYFSRDKEAEAAQDTDDSGPSSSPTSPISPPSSTSFSRPASALDSKRRSKTSSPQDFSRPTMSSSRRTTMDAKATSQKSASTPRLTLADLDKTEATANQKRPRAPLHTPKSSQDIPSSSRKSHSKRKMESPVSGRSSEKKTGLKQVLRESSQSITNMWNKEQGAVEGSGFSGKVKEQTRALEERASKSSKSKSSGSRSHHHTSSHGRRSTQTPDPIPRSSSRASYVSIHDHRHDSIMTDSYSINASGNLRPASPSVMRAEFSSHDSIARSRLDASHDGLAPPMGHRRIRSHAPSLYSLATNESQSSLILSSYYKKSAYGTSDALYTLRREGFVDGTFPTGHLLPNITRYMRFSSACYGSHFMKLTGISNDMPQLKAWDGMHHDVRHFVHHTESEAENILLASFVDPQGGSDSTGSTGTGVPLVHYISLDHEAKAVVLACRGTMGFEDVLADLTCDYDRLAWRGRAFRVHKGIHASARRLLYGGDGRVLVTLKSALQDFPDYGLVLCGHSLGAGVTSLLGVMLSEPNAEGPGFVTSAEPYTGKYTSHEASVDGKLSSIRLPAGRRIHVYAYGPPGVMSPSLRKLTRGLITSVVHGNDLVPHLSLGLLHDFQGLSLAFKRDENRTKAEIRQRIWNAFQDNVTERWYSNRKVDTKAPGNGEEERWMLPALEGMRASMKGEKLLPPGEVFTIETQRVLRRDAFLLMDEEHIGQPAQRIMLKYVRDVEGRFGEVRFGTSMLTDHSPAKYEDALNKLRVGVTE
ncbi:KCCR13L-like protein [Cladobotryum mycophilum]|uniref:sn-1-specific diacylglycerol lipase n=1 Tax=Cladobotryum mycophilum TaxID=491253 RepID=A0ABR0T3R7_9HYPO